MWGWSAGSASMNSLRAFGAEAEPGVTDEETAIEAPPEIGSDERRMHVRAYNYWVSLLDGRPYPSIEDLEPADLDDFGPQSVLLDFTAGRDNPAIAFIGRDLRAACGLGADIASVAEVPSRSLLSRLTDHYLQIIANCAPIGFEAEFVGTSGANTLYRGILMPLSSNGDTIDFIYGVINWKEVADGNTAEELAREVDRAVAATPAPASVPVWADGPNAEPVDGSTEAFGDARARQEIIAEIYEPDDQETLDLALGDDAALADRLSLARDTAEAVKHADARSRSALYRALGLAYDFALAAEAASEDYHEILEDAGLKAQARAPMTPIIKLIFGADYDKSRVTEFAAALSYGKREGIAPGGLSALLESIKGGLKGVVAAERRARRPLTDAKAAGEAARVTLRTAPALGYVDIKTGSDEFVLLVARREDDGRLAVVAPVDGGKKLIDRALRKSVG